MKMTKNKMHITRQMHTLPTSESVVIKLMTSFMEIDSGFKFLLTKFRNSSQRKIWTLTIKQLIMVV